MSAVPDAPAVSGRANRVVADLPDDLARRLRTWAGLRGQPVSHVLCELVSQAVPTAGQLAEQVRDIGASDGESDH